jgi:hypothetical protein
MFDKSSIGSQQGSRNKPLDSAALNDAASRNFRSLLQELIPGGTFRGPEYIVRNPTRNDRAYYRTGKRNDNATNESGGDFVSLVAHLRRCSQRDATLELASNVGLDVASSQYTRAVREQEESCEAPSHCHNEDGPAKGLQPPTQSHAIVGRDRLTWRKEGNHLYLYHRSSRRPLVGVVPDSKYPKMFRVQYPNGTLSDFVNLTRAKDAAAVFALRALNSKAQESASERPTGRRKPAPVVGDHPPASKGIPAPRKRLSCNLRQ